MSSEGCFDPALGTVTTSRKTSLSSTRQHPMDYFRSLGTSLLQQSGVVLPFALGDKVQAYENEGTIWSLYDGVKRVSRLPPPLPFPSVSLSLQSASEKAWVAIWDWSCVLLEQGRGSSCPTLPPRPRLQLVSPLLNDCSFYLIHFADLQRFLILGRRLSDLHLRL